MTRNSKSWRISCYSYQGAIIIIIIIIIIITIINFIIIIIIIINFITIIIIIINFIIIIIIINFIIIIYMRFGSFHDKNYRIPRKNHAKPDFSLYASDLFLEQLTQIVIHKIVDSFLRPKLFLVCYHISLQVLLVYHVTYNSRVFWI